MVLRKRSKTIKKKSRWAVGLAAMTLAGGAVVAASAPANASGINYYECAPSTGYCIQINGPHQAGEPNSCQWNEYYHMSWGMWYTGCSTGWWRPYVSS